MSLTVQSLYSNLKVLDEAILGVNATISDIEKLKADCVNQCEKCVGIKEQADCTELAAAKADLEYMQQNKKAKEYGDVITELHSASIILINLKTFITAITTVNDGEIVVPPKAVTYLVEEGINRYGTYDFAEHIGEIISGEKKEGNTEVIETKATDTTAKADDTDEWTIGEKISEKKKEDNTEVIETNVTDTTAKPTEKDTDGWPVCKNSIFGI